MIQLFALVAAALFTGAAGIISIAEQPARLPLEDQAMLAQWRRSYASAAPVQAGLVVIGTIFGVWSWSETGNIFLLAGAAFLIANLPFTLIVIKPTNDRLNKLEPARAVEARELIKKWGALHLVRTILGALAVCAFAVGSGA